MPGNNTPIGGIIAAVVVIGLLIFFLVRRDDCKEVNLRMVGTDFWLVLLSGVVIGMILGMVMRWIGRKLR